MNTKVLYTNKKCKYYYKSTIIDMSSIRSKKKRK